jgi:predicted  nucleic acid-binding Zn-ribbon protein
MTTYNRSGNKWRVNELLALQREYELLELSIQEIAAKHERSVKSILFKLDSEGFISNWGDARGYSEWENETHISDSSIVDDVSEVDKLTDRVWHLETSVEEISAHVKEMLNCLASNNKQFSRTLKHSSSLA